MPDASEFLKKWVRKNVNPTTAAMFSAGRLVEECLREAQGEGLSETEVKTAAGGNLRTFMVSELNRAAPNIFH